MKMLSDPRFGWIIGLEEVNPINHLIFPNPGSDNLLNRIDKVQECDATETY
jgi:hypothetical protein